MYARQRGALGEALRRNRHYWNSIDPAESGVAQLFQDVRLIPFDPMKSTLFVFFAIAVLPVGAAEPPPFSPDPFAPEPFRLQLQLPIGPIRVDLTTPLNAASHGKSGKSFLFDAPGPGYRQQKANASDLH